MRGAGRRSDVASRVSTHPPVCSSDYCITLSLTARPAYHITVLLAILLAISTCQASPLPGTDREQRTSATNLNSKWNSETTRSQMLVDHKLVKRYLHSPWDMVEFYDLFLKPSEAVKPRGKDLLIRVPFSVAGRPDGKVVSVSGSGMRRAGGVRALAPGPVGSSRNSRPIRPRVYMAPAPRRPVYLPSTRGTSTSPADTARDTLTEESPADEQQVLLELRRSLYSMMESEGVAAGQTVTEREPWHYQGQITTVWDTGRGQQ